MSEEQKIISIKQRILDEYRKHKTLDWAEIAARKIYSIISINKLPYDTLLGTVNQELTSKYHGVCWFAKKNKWKASILINNKHVYLGIYADESEAAFAFNTAFELFTNGAHTIINHVELGSMQASDVKYSVIERMLKKGYIINRNKTLNK